MAHPIEAIEGTVEAPSKSATPSYKSIATALGTVGAGAGLSNALYKNGLEKQKTTQKLKEIQEKEQLLHQKKEVLYHL